jgi:transcription initiation factor TFIIB
MVERIRNWPVTRRLESMPIDGKCVRCGKPALIETVPDGERLCGNCGLVVTERSVDQGPDWRSFRDEGEDRARAGGPTSITYWDMGLSTVIGSSNRDASGRAFGSTMRNTIDRLRMWDRRSPASSSQRSLIVAFRELDKTAEKLGLSRAVRERAAYIYRKALARGLLRGRSVTGISAAALYAAIRDTGTPRTLKDVAGAINLPRKDVARDYRKLLREMDLTMPVADAARSVHRIASQVGFSERVVRKAIGIVDTVEKREISAGKSPMGLAASSLYLAGVIEGEIKTQKEIADAAGVTEVTVRNRYQGLRADLGRELGLEIEGPHDNLIHAVEPDRASMK